EGIRPLLSPDVPGLLLLVAAEPAHAAAVVRLVHEIVLRRLPQILLLVETDTLAGGEGLAEVGPYLSCRVRWPSQTEELTRLLRERLALLPRPGGQEESPRDVIRRRLLSMTPSLLPLVERLALAAAHDVTVLLTGETGTGKTFLARLLHDCSPRRQEPFLVVPCAAQPATLLESTFFGHVKGAFTGADRSRVGKFEAAG